MLPASAGMIPPPAGEQAAHIHGAPRICGDDPEVKKKLKDARECSPHLRG